MAKRNFSAASREFEQAVDAGYPAARVDLGMLLSEPSAGMLNMMADVVREFRAVRKRYAPHPTLWQRLAASVSFE